MDHLFLNRTNLSKEAFACIESFQHTYERMRYDLPRLWLYFIYFVKRWGRLTDDAGSESIYYSERSGLSNHCNVS